MKFILPSITLSLFLSSCGTESAKDNYKDYEMSATDEDTITASILKSKDFTNAVFINHISLKDGQTAAAGLSFVMQMGKETFLVSAKHLLGPDAGFKEIIKPEEIPGKLAEWKATNLASNTSMAPSAANYSPAQGDVLLFTLQPGADKNIYQPFQLSKISIPANQNIVLLNGTDISASFFLVGYNNDKKETLYQLSLSGKNGEYYTFKKERNFDYHGFSGGPILDSKGNVFAILSGGLQTGDSELILGTKIRPLNVK